MKLQDKVCIVTGAASGIGKEIALVFAKEGGKVAIADMNLAAAQATADEITKAGGTAMAVAMDVTSEEQVESGVAAVVARWGRVDVLVSNALDDPDVGGWVAVLVPHRDLTTVIEPLEVLITGASMQEVLAAPDREQLLGWLRTRTRSPMARSGSTPAEPGLTVMIPCS